MKPPPAVALMLFMAGAVGMVALFTHSRDALAIRNMLFLTADVVWIASVVRRRRDR
jgi:FtsH-binding integral membrane protein